MSEVAMLYRAEPEEILQTAIEKKVPAIMTYLSKDKWHVAKVLLVSLGPDKLNIERTCSEKKPHPINIRVNQPVGISFKYGYGKFVFDTTVVGFEPSSDPANGGTIVLALPDRIEVVQRRSYFRVEVPESLKVKVVLWPTTRMAGSSKEAESEIRDTTRLGEGSSRSGRCETRNYYQGRLVNISAGGAQVVVPHQSETNPDVSPDFKKGQFVGVRFTPMPYEMPLMLNTQVRNVLPGADGKSIYLGLQTVGLEASPEGRKVLSRLVGVVERYFKINQSGAKQQDMHGAQNVV